MKAAKLHDSIKDLNKDIMNCEKTLTKVMKVKENQLKGITNPSLLSSRKETNKKENIRKPSLQGTAKKDLSKDRNSTHEAEAPVLKLSKSPTKTLVSNDRTLVHKEVIGDSKGSTRVEVVVRTKPYRKRSRSTHVSQFEVSTPRNRSRDPPKRSSGITSEKSQDPGCKGAKTNQSWAHILQQQSLSSSNIGNTRLGYVNGHRNSERVKRMEDESSCNDVDYWIGNIQNEKPSPSPKSPGKVKNNVRKSGDNDGYFSVFDPVRTLNFLIKELRGKFHKDCDENMQRIVEDMEKALLRIPGEDNVPHQQTTQSLQNAVPDPGRSRSSLANGSGNVSGNSSCIGNARLSDPRSHHDAATSGATRLVSNLFSTVARMAHITKTSPTTTKIPQQTFIHEEFPADPTTAALQAQLELGCKQLEDTCKQMEETCDSLRRQRDELTVEVHTKTRQLEAALNKNQQLTVYAADLRQEIVRVQQSAEAAQRNHEKLVIQLKNQYEESLGTQSQQKNRLKEAARDNERLTMELQVSHLEKDKLRVLLANKDLEAAKLKKEIIDIHALVAEQLASLRSVSDQNCILTKLDEILQNSAKLNDMSTTDDNFSVTLTEVDECSQKKRITGLHNGGAGEGGEVRPICSSPTSSANSSLYSSWKMLSNITAAEANFIFETKKNFVDDGKCDEKLETESAEKKTTDSGINTLSAADLLVSGKPLSDHESRRNSPAGDEHFRTINYRLTAERLKAGIQDVFQEMKKQTAEAVCVTLPSPPKDFPAVPELLGVSQWTELSASESIILQTSDETHSDSM